MYVRISHVMFASGLVSLGGKPKVNFDKHYGHEIAQSYRIIISQNLFFYDIILFYYHVYPPPSNKFFSHV